jgi:hypothetical protein
MYQLRNAIIVVATIAMTIVVGIAVRNGIRNVSADRQAARRVMAENDLHLIFIAFAAYRAQHNDRFPPSATYDANGKPLLSWRVAMLPYLDETQLYSQFKQDEPWDSPHNRTLIEKMPDVFRSYGDVKLAAGETCFLAPVGDHAAFGGREGFHPPGFTSKRTIMIVEAAPERKTIWTKPDDLNVAESDPAAGLGGWRDGVFLAAYDDGSVHDVPLTTSKEVLWALFRTDSTDPTPAELIDN